MKRSIYIFYISALLALAADKVPAAESTRPSGETPSRSASADTSIPPSPTVNISDLVTETLAHNPELAFYRAEIDATKADRRTATARPNPAVKQSLKLRN